MSKKNSYITITDQFCGAGGSSQGARRLSRRYGGGIEVKMALNHWKLAIETHSTNFPDTLHDCTDISACDPRRYPSTDILITSPECTTHSPAGGNTHKTLKKQMDLFDSGKIDPATERSRATMWDVCRFAEYHNYNIIIVENVVEAKTRWPLFEVWLQAMHTLGYDHRCVYLNSMHCHPTPQSRDRMYVVFWKKGNKAPDLDYRPVAYCSKCSNNIHSIQAWKNKERKYGKYRQQYVYCCPGCNSVVDPYYYAAFNCIDWTDIGVRIGDRKKPLADNTIKRIRYGLKKYGNQPLQVINYSPGYTRPITGVTSTITCDDHHGILTPFLVDDKHTSGLECRVRSMEDVTGTMHCDPRVKLLIPMIIKGEHTRQLNVRSSYDPMFSQTGTQSISMVSWPFLTISRGESLAAEINKPINTITSGGIHSGIVSSEYWNTFLTSYYGSGHCTKHITEELGAVTTADRHSLISYQEPNIENCYYRMLKPHEIKLAMAFDSDYVVLGSGKWQVKQLGNAVTPPVMEWLLEQCIKTLQ